MGDEQDGGRCLLLPGRQRRLASVVNSIELVEYAATVLHEKSEENQDGVATANDDNAGVEGIVALALAEQGSTSVSASPIWIVLLHPSLMAQLQCLDLSFNELDDAFWTPWETQRDGRFSGCTAAEWCALSVLVLSNNRFTSASVAAIASFVAKCPRLRILDLSLNALGSTRKAPMITAQQISSDSKDGSPLAPLLDALEHHDAAKSSVTQLEELDLSCIGSWQQCCGPSNVESLERFMQTIHTSMRQIQLRSIALGDEHAAVIADSLPAMTSLEALVLSGNEISDVGAARLAFSLDCATCLRTLDLASNQITRKAVLVFQRAISLLRKPFALRQLHFEYNIDIRPGDLTQLHELLQATVLKTFLLSDPKEGITTSSVGDSGEDAKADLVLSLNGKAAAQLLGRDVCLIGRHVRVVVDVLRTAHKWRELQELNLSGNRVGPSGAAAIALYLSLHPPLRRLNLSTNAMDDAVAVVLAGGVEASSTLEELDLSQNNITDAGAIPLYLKAFSRVLSKHRRVHVTNGNALTPECRLVLQSISQAHDLRKRFDADFSTLTHINLSGKMLRQYGARAIVDKLLAMDTPSCSSLDLSHNALGDDGASVVARLLCEYPRLEKLDLSFNGIGDAGAAVIADALARNSSLQLLTLHSVPDGSVAKPRLTEAGLVRIALALQSHGAIASVDLRRNAVSAGVTRALLDLVRVSKSVQRVNGTSAAAFSAKCDD